MHKRQVLILLSVGLLISFAKYLLDNKRDPITITSYASVTEMSLDDLIAKADIIAIGEFSAIQPSRWSTPNGKLPPNTTLDYVSEHRLRIFSDSPFHTSSILKGESQSPVIRVRTFGGSVGQDSMTISGEPVYETDKLYLLFLYYNTGTTADIDSGAYYGSYVFYEIIDGQAVSARDKWLLEDLIAYIEKPLAAATAVPTESPTLPELLTPTLLVSTDTPIPTATPTPAP
jgi:hypothetical protein